MPSVPVPCNGCTACCKYGAIVLHPEHGDDPTQYATKQVVHPLTGKVTTMLQHKKNGDCIYLGVGGCTIHGRAPIICREFDCRRFYLKFTAIPRPQRRRMLRDAKERTGSTIGQDVLDAGKERLHTLEAE